MPVAVVQSPPLDVALVVLPPRLGGHRRPMTVVMLGVPAGNGGSNTQRDGDDRRGGPGIRLAGVDLR